MWIDEFGDNLKAIAYDEKQREESDSFDRISFFKARIYDLLGMVKVLETENKRLLEENKKLKK